MHGYRLIAIYPTLADAQRVQSCLTAEGIEPKDIRLTHAPELQAVTPEHGAQPGFVAWLMGTNIPAPKRDRYTAHLTADRAALAVRAEDEQLRRRAVGIMEAGRPIDLDNERALEQVTPSPRVVPERAAPVAPVPPRDEGTMRDRAATADLRASSSGTEARPWLVEPAEPRREAAMARPAEPAREAALKPTSEQVVDGDSVIQLVKEEVSIGKRIEERRYRVRTYVIERPIEQKLMLREEHVEIEHRPAARPVPTGPEAGELARHHNLEIIERSERPVVEKRTTVEEVVIHKHVVERPETVRATMRETRIEVEKEPAETAAETAPRP